MRWDKKRHMRSSSLKATLKRSQPVGWGSSRNNCPGPSMMPSGVASLDRTAPSGRSGCRAHRYMPAPGSWKSSNPRPVRFFSVLRCAAASYDVLSKIGLFKPYSNDKNVITHFYPKLLRKKILKWADRNNYTIISNEGRPSRKWESDKGVF